MKTTTASCVLLVCCMLVVVASATYIDRSLVGTKGWVNGYGFNAFQGIHNGYHNGYHGIDNVDDFSGYNGLVGYNNRHLYNGGYDSGFYNGYNNGPVYNIPHNNARFGFNQPLGGLNGYYAHPEEVDVFPNSGEESGLNPQFVESRAQQQQQQQQPQQQQQMH